MTHLISVNGWRLGLLALVMGGLVLTSCTPPPEPIVTTTNDVEDDTSTTDHQTDTTSPHEPQQGQDVEEEIDTCIGPSCGPPPVEDTGSEDTGPTETTDDTGPAEEDVEDDIQEPVDPCDPSPCPATATCTAVGDNAECECPAGQRLEGDQCVPDGPTSYAGGDGAWSAFGQSVRLDRRAPPSPGESYCNKGGRYVTKELTIVEGTISVFFEDFPIQKPRT